MLPGRSTRDGPVPERLPVSFGRRDAPRDGDGTDAANAFPAGATKLDDDIVGALIPERPARGHKGSFGKLLVIAGSLDYAGAALLVCRSAGRSGGVRRDVLPVQIPSEERFGRCSLKDSLRTL